MPLAVTTVEIRLTMKVILNHFSYRSCLDIKDFLIVKLLVNSPWAKHLDIMRRLNCPAPFPPTSHHFFCCCPGVLITLIFTYPALYNHHNHPFFGCPALFYHTHIFSDPGAARGGDGGRTIWPAHYTKDTLCFLKGACLKKFRVNLFKAITVITRVINFTTRYHELKYLTFRKGKKSW